MTALGKCFRELILLGIGKWRIEKQKIDAMKKWRFIPILFTILVISNSCLNRQFVEGRAEIVSSSYLALNDSSLVFGHLYHVDGSGVETCHENEFEIWIENSDLKTTNDTTRYYSLKVAPGTYTIKGQSSGNKWARLIEEVKNVDLKKNTKTEINFYIGYAVE